MCVCDCIECGRERRRRSSLFCSRACRNVFALNMPESVSCYGCDACEEGVIDALLAGWTNIDPDPEGRSWNYIGVCPVCAKEGG